MKKQRVYKGCELDSPIYRQIIAENNTKNNLDNQGLNINKTKRGNTHTPKIRIYKWKQQQ